MRIAVGIGRDLGLSEDDRTTLASHAARLGYESAWTNAVGLDGLDRCARWFRACGIATAVGVVPTLGTPLDELVARTRALREETGGKFILGVGIGHPKEIPKDANAISLMRDHLQQLRSALGPPIYLAAVGPQMLRLAGKLSDGAMPNYMDPPQIRWARELIAEGARAAGRDPGSIALVQFVRVVVDDDPVVARRALAKTIFAYALSTPGEVRVGTYYSMVRMGLGDAFDALEKLRAKGATEEELTDACPDAVLDRLGVWGRPEAAASKLRSLSEGLDVSIVRIVNARPGIDSALATIRACAPANVPT
jgi:hypothetical protein